MEKQRRGESSIQQQPWIPYTPVKQISPIYPFMVEEPTHRYQVEERRFDLNGFDNLSFDMNGLDNLSFGDLLGLANHTSAYYPNQNPWFHNVPEPTGNSEIVQKANEPVESLSSVSNDVVEQIIKTPEKPKRKKHRPKVVKEAKPKRERKPQAPRKSVGADGQESKTPRRKYVRKKVEVNKGNEFTPVESTAAAIETSTHAKKLCRRALDFEAANLSERGTIQAEKTESVPTERLLDSGNQDFLLPVPSTPQRKRKQSIRKGMEPKNNGSNQDNVELFPARAAKRRQGKEPTSFDTNLMGMQYAELSDNQKYCLYFKNLQQECLRFDAIRSTSFPGQRREDMSAFDYSFTSQCSANGFLNMEERGKYSFQGGQQSESNVFPNKIDTPIKNKTAGHARFRNLSSLNKAMEISEQFPLGCHGRPQQNSNKILVDKRVTVSKKKGITKSEKSQKNQKTLLLNRYQFPASFAGPPPDQLWKQLYSVEAISEQLRLLDINRENSQTAIVPHSSQGNEIVLFNSGAGAIVPLAPVKKRPARPKVDLDNETDRVWKLLLENINSEGIDGSDEQKAKWWEEERNVFRGRADSFIARMHLVQGDRRFTPWKGSVVDSVVGVFLTQNVSDHLSSSAFMSLAAEFPASYIPNRNFDVGTSSMPSIQITYLDSEESMSTPPNHDQRSFNLNDTQPDEEKDYVSSNETSRSSSEIASSAHESVGKTTDLRTHVALDREGLNVEVDKTDYKCLVEDQFPSEDSAITCQNSIISDALQSTDGTRSSLETNSEGDHRESMVKLLHLVSGQRQGRYDVTTASTVLLEESNEKNQHENSRQVSAHASPRDCSSEVKDFKSLHGNIKSSVDSNEPYCCYQQDGDVLSCQNPEMPESFSSVPSTKHKERLVKETLIPDINESTSCLDVQEGTEKPPGPDTKQHQDQSCKELNPTDAKGKKQKKPKKEKKKFDWDSLRREAQGREGKREKTTRTMDSVDWEKIRTVDVSEIAETIKRRGMNNTLSERIQDFLNRLVREHGSIDLEWLRDVPPDKAKEYLLSFKGLGLKSVECVRLLTLHHLAFPVDTNVGRIAVRLGWVPLQPLPESLQLHLLEMYPILESIQKYLWPRLCKLDQKTLYELHYQLITFGKVFCTKSKPNCNACPMRGECRHFASAFASARLALPGTEKCNETPDKNPLPLHLPEPLQREQGSEVVKHSEPLNKVKCCEPIIEEPASPEPENAEVSIADIEDAFYEDPEEIPTIRLNMDAFTKNLKKIMEHCKELQEENMSNALVALTAEAASLPMPKLKNISQLRTEHQVYELPDTHPLLAELEKREPDDPCSYLLAIWTPGETADSIEPAVSKCIFRDNGTLCDEETCFSCNSIKEARSQTVRGTILIPCRTAMRGSFPLNGTYFQVNEVFADHASSLNPIDVPRQWLWDLPRRTVYFGTSIPSIFKGLTTETIQQCFWRGYVCVRGFDRKTRGPKPLIARLHFPASKKKSQANPPKTAHPSIT